MQNLQTAYHAKLTILERQQQCLLVLCILHDVWLHSKNIKVIGGHIAPVLKQTKANITKTVWHRVIVTIGR